MAQALLQENMRGKKRPWCDDNSQTVLPVNPVPGHLVVPDYQSTSQPNFMINSSLEADPSQSLFEDTSFVVPSAEEGGYSRQDTSFDAVGWSLMGDQTTFQSSFEDEFVFEFTDLPHGDSPPRLHGEEVPNGWEIVLQNRPSDHGNVAPDAVFDAGSDHQNQRPVTSSREGPKEQEWDEHRPLITLLYGPEKPSLNLTLQQLMAVMDHLGFLKGATDNMYKNRFSKWGIVKNESNGARRRRSRPQQQATSTSSSAGITPSPPHSQPFPPGRTEETGFVFPEFAKALHAICQESMEKRPNGTWDLDDKFRVTDDDWEDAYGSAAALTLELFHNPDSPSARSPWETIHDDIAPMVRSLNYFSVPTLFMITYLMCAKSNDPRLRHVPACFLGGCLHVSRVEAEKGSSRHVWLTQILEGLYSFTQRGHDNKALLQVLSLIIPCYMQLVRDYGDSDGATALSLLSFYHVQIGSADIWLERTLDKINCLLKEVEDKEPGGKASIEILGLAIMVLQEMKDDKALMLEASKMRRLCGKQLKRLPGGHQERKYYLDRLLDGYHLETRLALKMGNQRLVNELREDYEDLVRSEDKTKDGFAKILEIEIEEMTSRLEGAALGSG